MIISSNFIGFLDLKSSSDFFGINQHSQCSYLLTFIFKVIYLQSIDVRADTKVEMSAMTPVFHRKIYCYAVMTDQNGEWIQFGITPMSNVRNISADTVTNGTAAIDRIDDGVQAETVLLEEEEAQNIDMTTPNADRLKDEEQIEEEAALEMEENAEDTTFTGDPREGMDTEVDAETQTFGLDAPGNATRFTIESGTGITYEVLVIRGEAIFGLPKYQVFSPPAPRPCPKQKRIIIVESLHLWHTAVIWNAMSG